MSDDPRLADLARLEQGVLELTTSARWREFLKLQSIFHQYSYRNALLISRQYPTASNVAGFRAWRALGRSVRRGERAIWILAPTGRGRPFDERRVEEEAPRPPIRFVAVPVFDVAQTEGRALPAVCRALEGGEDSGLFERLLGVGGDLGYRVELAGLADGVNGECHFSDRLIRIEVANGPSQRVKSLAHELAHAVLHGEARDRSLAELEAESVAYLVCRRFGIDSSAYSFGYVATWAREVSDPAQVIHRSCGRIQNTVDRVIELERAHRGPGSTATES